MNSHSKDIADPLSERSRKPGAEFEEEPGDLLGCIEERRIIEELRILEEHQKRTGDLLRIMEEKQRRMEEQIQEMLNEQERLNRKLGLSEECPCVAVTDKERDGPEGIKEKLIHATGETEIGPYDLLSQHIGTIVDETENIGDTTKCAYTNQQCNTTEVYKDNKTDCTEETAANQECQKTEGIQDDPSKCAEEDYFRASDCIDDETVNSKDTVDPENTVDITVNTAEQINDDHPEMTKELLNEVEIQSKNCFQKGLMITCILPLDSWFTTLPTERKRGNGILYSSFTKDIKRISLPQPQIQQKDQSDVRLIPALEYGPTYDASQTVNKCISSNLIEQFKQEVPQCGQGKRNIKTNLILEESFVTEWAYLDFAEKKGIHEVDRVQQFAGKEGHNIYRSQQPEGIEGHEIDRSLQSAKKEGGQEFDRKEQSTEQINDDSLEMTKELWNEVEIPSKNFFQKSLTNGMTVHCEDNELEKQCVSAVREPSNLYNEHTELVTDENKNGGQNDRKINNPIFGVVFVTSYNTWKWSEQMHASSILKNQLVIRVPRIRPAELRRETEICQDFTSKEAPAQTFKCTNTKYYINEFGQYRHGHTFMLQFDIQQSSNGVLLTFNIGSPLNQGDKIPPSRPLRNKESECVQQRKHVKTDSLMVTCILLLDSWFTTLPTERKRGNGILFSSFTKDIKRISLPQLQIQQKDQPDVRLIPTLEYGPTYDASQTVNKCISSNLIEQFKQEVPQCGQGKRNIKTNLISEESFVTECAYLYFAEKKGIHEVDRIQQFAGKEGHNIYRSQQSARLEGHEIDRSQQSAKKEGHEVDRKEQSTTKEGVNDVDRSQQSAEIDGHENDRSLQSAKKECHEVDGRQLLAGKRGNPDVNGSKANIGKTGAHDFDNKSNARKREGHDISGNQQNEGNRGSQNTVFEADIKDGNFEKTLRIEGGERLRSFLQIGDNNLMVVKAEEVDITVDTDDIPTMCADTIWVNTETVAGTNKSQMEIKPKDQLYPARNQLKNRVFDEMDMPSGAENFCVPPEGTASTGNEDKIGETGVQGSSIRVLHEIRDQLRGDMILLLTVMLNKNGMEVKEYQQKGTSRRRLYGLNCNADTVCLRLYDEKTRDWRSSVFLQTGMDNRFGIPQYELSSLALRQWYVPWTYSTNRHDNSSSHNSLSGPMAIPMTPVPNVTLLVSQNCDGYLRFQIKFSGSLIQSLFDAAKVKAQDIVTEKYACNKVSRKLCLLGKRRDKCLAGRPQAVSGSIKPGSCSKTKGPGSVEPVTVSKSACTSPINTTPVAHTVLSAPSIGQYSLMFPFVNENATAKDTLAKEDIKNNTNDRDIGKERVAVVFGETNFCFTKPLGNSECLSSNVRSTICNGCSPLHVVRKTSIRKHATETLTSTIYQGMLKSVNKIVRKKLSSSELFSEFLDWLDVQVSQAHDDSGYLILGSNNPNEVISMINDKQSDVHELLYIILEDLHLGLGVCIKYINDFQLEVIPCSDCVGKGGI